MKVKIINVSEAVSWHEIHKFDNGYGASILNEYNCNGLFEVALLEGDEINDVMKYCTSEDVDAILLEIKNLPKT